MVEALELRCLPEEITKHWHCLYLGLDPFCCLKKF